MTGPKIRTEEDSKVPMGDVKGAKQQARMKRVIEFDASVLVALEEVALRLQDTSFNQLVEQAVMTELRRREITWWESRERKGLRTITTKGGVL